MIKTFTFYAIKHIPSGKFLPESKHGYTHVDPTDKVPPRLFTKKRNAQVALTFWLKGKFVEHWSQGGYYDPDPELYYDAEPVPGRKKEDMKVVEMVLTETQTELDL